MMTFLVLLTLIACGDKDPGTTHEPGTCSTDDGGTGDGGSDTGGSDAGGSDTGIDLSHCDATGYLPWLEALVAEYEETGRCPEIPAEVPMLDGTMYVPEPVEYRTEGSHASGEFQYHPLVPSWRIEFEASSSPVCADGEDSSGKMDDDWSLVVYASVADSSVSPSVIQQVAESQRLWTSNWRVSSTKRADFVVQFVTTGESGRRLSAYAGNDEELFSGDTEIEKCGYSVVCIDQYGSTAGPYFDEDEETPGGRLLGWSFVHVEQWWDISSSSYVPSSEPGPRDLIVYFDGDLDCTTYAEDASFWGPTHGEEWIWPNWDIAVCDGVDNDYDGEIDEGGPRRDARRLDRDDNGIPDCQQDCDGDGIPNYDDLDDLDECTPTGLESGVVPGIDLPSSG